MPEHNEHYIDITYIEHEKHEKHRIQIHKKTYEKTATEIDDI